MSDDIDRIAELHRIDRDEAEAWYNASNPAELMRLLGDEDDRDEYQEYRDAQLTEDE